MFVLKKYYFIIQYFSNSDWMQKWKSGLYFLQRSILSSKLMRFGVIDFSNLNSEKSFDASSSRRLSPYCNSKLLNAYFGHELALRTSGTGVSVYTVCPGFSYTRLFRYSRAPWYRWLLFIPVGLFVMRTSKQVPVPLFII